MSPLRIRLTFLLLCLLPVLWAGIELARLDGRTDGWLARRAADAPNEAMQRAQHYLHEYARQFGHLPCPATDPAAAESVGAPGLCAPTLQGAVGVAEGYFPWQEFAPLQTAPLPEDLPPLSYRVRLWATDTRSCGWNESRQDGWSASVGAGPDDPQRAMKAPLSLSVCAPGSDTARSGIVGESALLWRSQGALYAWPGMAPIDGANLWPADWTDPENGIWARSPDGRWLAAAKEEEGQLWIHWWRWDSAESQWRGMGRWRVPSGAKLETLRMGGTRLLALISDKEAWRLADIPLMADARPVRLTPFPLRRPAAFQLSAAGHWMALLDAGKTHWRLQPLDGKSESWPGPVIGANVERLEGTAERDMLVGWTPGSRTLLLWRREGRAWRQDRLLAPSPVAQAHLLRGQDALVVRLAAKDGVSAWAGWRLEEKTVPPAIPQDELPSPTGAVEESWTMQTE